MADYPPGWAELWDSERDRVNRLDIRCNCFSATPVSHHAVTCPLFAADAAHLPRCVFTERCCLPEHHMGACKPLKDTHSYPDPDWQGWYD